MLIGVEIELLSDEAVMKQTLGAWSFSCVNSQAKSDQTLQLFRVERGDSIKVASNDLLPESLDVVGHEWWSE